VQFYELFELASCGSSLALLKHHSSKEHNYELHAAYRGTSYRNLCTEESGSPTVPDCNSDWLSRKYDLQRVKTQHRATWLPTQQAHEKAMQRRREKVSTHITPSTWGRVEMLTRQEFSPEQICGRLAIEDQQTVSHESIYQYIYADKAQGGDLHSFLRCQKERKKRYGSHSRRGKIPNRISIDERPDVVDERSRIGDWEGDTIIGKGHSGAIVSLVDRFSRYTLLHQLPDLLKLHLQLEFTFIHMVIPPRNNRSHK